MPSSDSDKIKKNMKIRKLHFDSNSLTGMENNNEAEICS